MHTRFLHPTTLKKIKEFLGSSGHYKFSRTLMKMTAREQVCENLLVAACADENPVGVGRWQEGGGGGGAAG